jgi:hypothetical protein
LSLVRKKKKKTNYYTAPYCGLSSLDHTLPEMVLSWMAPYYPAGCRAVWMESCLVSVREACKRG